MKIVCTDRTIDCPLAADVFGLVENYMADFPSETSISVPFAAGPFERYYRSLFRPGPVAECHEIEEFMLAKVSTKDLECRERCDVFAGVSLGTLKAARENGCLWTVSCLRIAAGRPECLEYALKNGCPRDSSCAIEAAAARHVELFKFICENCGSWNMDAMDEKPETLVVEYDCDALWADPRDERPAESGHVTARVGYEYDYEPSVNKGEMCDDGGGILRYTNEPPKPPRVQRSWGEECTVAAAATGELECLRFAHENGCEWTAECTQFAAKNGHIECLRYAHENGCEWTSECTVAAAGNGHLECLRYLVENDCALSHRCMRAAAANGHLECLKFAREHSNGWDKSCTAAAAEHGHLECLRYAHENGCPWNAMCTMLAADYGHVECLRYARENGCE